MFVGSLDYEVPCVDLTDLRLLGSSVCWSVGVGGV